LRIDVDQFDDATGCQYFIEQLKNPMVNIQLIKYHIYLFCFTSIDLYGIVFK